MGSKRGKSNRSTADNGNRDARDIERVIRRLGLVDSRQPLPQWVAAVSRELPDDSVEAFLKNSGPVAVQSDYDVPYRDYDHARLLAGSWASASITIQLEWLLPRLRATLAQVDKESRFLVEIGAGPGIHAAIVAAILKAPVIAIDPHPSALGLAEQFAARTGGNVTSVTAGAEHLTAVLNGRTPAAIYGMGVFRYFQPHNHDEYAYSYRTVMDQCLTDSKPAPASVTFFNDAQPADVLLIESGCPDYLAEVLLGAQHADYHLATAGAAVLDCSTVGTDHKDMIAMHFTTRKEHATTKHPLVEMYTPLPAARPELEIDGPAAEAFRVAHDTHITTHATHEVTYPNGTLRRELFTLDPDTCGVYQSSNLGFRHLQLHPHESLTSLDQDFGQALTDAQNDPTVQVRPLFAPAITW